MKKIFVFIGKPGVGKTTLIDNIFNDYKKIDVMPYVRNYLDKNTPGLIPEHKTIQGYKDMYDALRKIKAKEIVVELGTNHPTVNIDELKKLSQNYQVYLFLCTASIKTCHTRATSRNRFIDPDSLEKRLRRDFPNSYLKLLQNTDLNYNQINTEKPLEENIKIIEKIKKMPS